MGKIIFITGGVRSGKSAFALEYAMEIGGLLSTNSFCYIASGVAFDDEMKQRIKRHQLDRATSTVKWETIEIIDEIPLQMNLSKHQVIVWDCITTWLSNVLYKSDPNNYEERQTVINRYLNNFKECILYWKDKEVNVFLVSNELFDEPISQFDEVNLYRHILGNLHQWIVANCDEAYELDYSIYKRWK
nr:bifunctional adenosylcobinamide kinase/adenosylcobinamide-phosphate guanylyltransferase [Lysinibacillus timonensis]